MNENNYDPIEERFVHARELLDSRYRKGEGVEGSDLLDLRDDLIFLYRMARRESDAEHIVIHGRIEGVELQVKNLDDKKIDRVPALARAAWLLLPIVAGFILTVIWATAQGGNP